MSYDLYLYDPEKEEEVINLDQPHPLKGGTYAVGGTTECHLNITYNYGAHFRKVLGEDGIRSLYGKTGRESLPILWEAINKLGNDVSDNYWEATEGNAKAALRDLAVLATLAPHGIWGGD